MPMLDYYLMSKKGLAVLLSLVRSGSSAIHAVIGARDASVQNDYYDEIRSACAEHGIPFRDRKEHGETAPYAVAVSWRWIIHSYARLIILHDSLLPRYRGFAPLPNALINGEPRIGVTALYASDDYDCGDIIAQESCPVEYPCKIQCAIEKLTPLYCKLVNRITAGVERNEEPVAQPQDNADASYSLWRDESDYVIDWGRSAEKIRRFVDAVGYPYQGASTHLDGRLVRVMEAVPVPDVRIENRTPGKLIFQRNGNPVIVCGQGLLELHDVRDEAGASALPLRKFRVRCT